MHIEDYAIVGDTQTVALVGLNGSIDWLCFPRFDSAACFAALLGTHDHGRWLIAPVGTPNATRRRYRDGTLILETEIATSEGTVRLIDFMPIRGRAPDMIRIVEGVSGSVTMQCELDARFDFGAVVPWVRLEGDRWQLVAGPDALELATPIALGLRAGGLSAEFLVRPGDRVPFALTWYASYEAAPNSPEPEEALAHTERFWIEWVQRCTDRGPYRDAIVRSLLTLKALTYEPSGGIVAAGTTSLPEELGGARNWDYRYCWVRDATLTLQALLDAGYRDEAHAWREWLVRAVAGEPARLQIMYGVTGERRIDERVLEWLPGYEGSLPVRIGNAAVGQRQLDVYGELMDLLYQARCAGIETSDDAWAVQRATLDWLESHWAEPDAGLWEVRGPERHFTFSKVMVWTAFDRAVKTVEQLRLDGPVDRWRALRDHVHAETCRHGFDPGRGAFTQAFGSRVLDASLLLIPIVGFLPPRDPRVLGTIDAIARELVRDGFVQRYPTEHRHDNVDGLPGAEGAFLACSFWLVDALVLAGHREQARALFERLLSVRNDVGLLSEEYDTRSRRLVGNFPQAFSHVALINSAHNLAALHGPAEQRASRSRHGP
jgi:GH15 family glucan-1,4-alpha-glucosidase